MDLKLETELNRAIDGSAVSLMCDVAFRIPGATACCSMIHHVTFFTPVEFYHGKGSPVLLNFRKRTVAGQIWVEPTEESIWFQRQNPDIRDQLSVMETCAGIGIMGSGFQNCGMPTSCYNDYNPRFCQWLRTKMQTPVIEGNLTSASTIHAVHCAGPTSQAISGGVACQPFSSLGDRREQQDQRSESFTGVLTMGYYLKCLIIFLECTKEALTSAWAQDVLNKFCLLTGFKCQQTLLTLHQLWPSARTRWWAVLHHPSIGVQSIPPVPSLKFEPSIVNLLPQLALSIHELAAFNAQPKGILWERD